MIYRYIFIQCVALDITRITFFNILSSHGFATFAYEAYSQVHSQNFTKVPHLQSPDPHRLWLECFVYACLPMWSLLLQLSASHHTRKSFDHINYRLANHEATLIAMFMGPTWGPPGTDSSLISRFAVVGKVKQRKSISYHLNYILIFNIQKAPHWHNNVNIYKKCVMNGYRQMCYTNNDNLYSVRKASNDRILLHSSCLLMNQSPITSRK